MARRDVIIPPYRAPGGALTTVEIEFQLVDVNRAPVPGMRVFDDEGISHYHLLTTSDQDQIVSLTPQDGIYGDTFWRTRVGLLASSEVPLSNRHAKYREYYVAMPDGAPIDFSDFLNLDQGYVPGQPPLSGSQVLPFYTTGGGIVYLPLLTISSLPFYLSDGSQVALPLLAGP